MDSTIFTVSRSLFLLIDREWDTSAISLLNRIASAMWEMTGDADKAVFLELQLWSGLLADTPDMGKEYRDVVVASFPWLVEGGDSEVGPSTR